MEDTEPLDRAGEEAGARALGSLPEPAAEAARVGPYELGSMLGRGGMGSVYMARRTGPGGFDRRVAIKRIHAHLADDPELRALFLDEARIAATVHHRNVAQVFELGEADGTLYLTMELLEGVHLGALLSRRGAPLTGELGAFVIAEAARGLAAAHDARSAEGVALGLVHRDVSPQNVFVTSDGAVKVTDFGIARAKDRLSATKSGRVRGKPSYMAPEQALGDPVDRRADVFSLGAVLFELTTGVSAFRGDTDAQTTLNVLAGLQVSPEQLVAGYPAPLWDIVRRALAVKPSDRWPTAAAMADALDSWLESRPRTGPASLARAVEEALTGSSERAGEVLPKRARPPALEPSPAASPPPDPGAAGAWPRRAAWVVAALVVVFAVAWFARGPETESIAATATREAAAAAETRAAEAEPEAVTALEPEGAVVAPETAATEPEAVASAETETQGAASGAHPALAKVRRVRPPSDPVHASALASPGGEAFLNLLTVPASRVTLDGRYLGQTPLVRRAVPSGAHTLELVVESSGARRSLQVELAPGQTWSRRLDLGVE